MIQINLKESLIVIARLDCKFADIGKHTSLLRRQQPRTEVG